MSEAQEWLYTDTTGAEHGPVSADELKQLGATGVIHALTDVWTEGLEEWVPASQIEGVIPSTPVVAPPPPVPAQPAQPAHVPQINLGAGSGMHLESTITARPMGDTQSETSANPYALVNQPKKNPVGWIIFAIIAVVAIGVGIYFAVSPSGDPKPEDTPGYIEYSKANDLIDSKKNADILGNDGDALEISKAFAASLKTHVDPAIEESFPGLLEKEGEIRTYTMAKTEGELKTTVFIVRVLKFKMLSAKAQKAMADSVWLIAKSSLANTPYNDPKTQLVVALRDSEKYSKVMIGHPVASDAKNVKTAPGITESHDGAAAEDKLYPFFARKK